MLARSREIYLPAGVVLKTPLLCPAFSSKGFPELSKITEVMREFIVGGILVSAYDVHYKNLSSNKITFPEVVLLDSGGYEARLDSDLGDVYSQEYKPKPWTQNLYAGVIKKWPRLVPTIIVSFDSPRNFLRLKDQISHAKSLRKITDLPIELLIKPESRKDATVSMENVIRHVNELRSFNAVGLTEKELGSVMLDRMTNIARLRKAMDEAKADIPIHIFGSLDTLTTPLYFISGAEIFDGLTWLKYGYYEGHTLYSQNYGSIQDSNGLIRNSKEQIFEMWKNNYYYLSKLRDQMINYARVGEFSQFRHVDSILEEAFRQLQARL